MPSAADFVAYHNPDRMGYGIDGITEMAVETIQRSELAASSVSDEPFFGHQDTVTQDCSRPSVHKKNEGAYCRFRLVFY